MLADRAHWTADDVRERAARGLRWAWEAGTTRLRTPCRLVGARRRAGRLAACWPSWPRNGAAASRLEQVALIKLPLFEDLAQAPRRWRARIAATGPQALLGGFVHSTNWSERRCATCC